eukprot:1161695-Pelagomonas_calceolata.AAC.8
MVASLHWPLTKAASNTRTDTQTQVHLHTYTHIGARVGTITDIHNCQNKTRTPAATHPYCLRPSAIALCTGLVRI